MRDTHTTQYAFTHTNNQSDRSGIEFWNQNKSNKFNVKLFIHHLSCHRCRHHHHYYCHISLTFSLGFLFFFLLPSFCLSRFVLLLSSFFILLCVCVCVCFLCF